MDVQINRDDGLAMLYLFARYKLHPNNMQMNIADKDDAKAIDCRAADTRCGYCLSSIDSK